MGYKDIDHIHDNDIQHIKSVACRMLYSDFDHVNNSSMRTNKNSMVDFCDPVISG